MSSKDGLCLWCGRWTEGRSPIDGLAECDRQECIERRIYDEDTYTGFTVTGSVKDDPAADKFRQEADRCLGDHHTTPHKGCILR